MIAKALRIYYLYIECVIIKACDTFLHMNVCSIEVFFDYSLTMKLFNN